VSRRGLHPATLLISGASLVSVAEGKGGSIEIMLPNGARVSVDAFVNVT
jgi:hypothetical protein